ncbi:MAG: YraN family protein [Muribaculaceae bacterium]|nr:YraN family protein [Muribaculaceae bacterium]
MARHNETGRWGEDLACEKLVREGYAICERNWRMGHYEIDIVAMKDNFVVFCEVKTRSDGDIDPLEAIDEKKIRHMATSADVYMKHKDVHYDARFDVFGISGNPEEYKIEHIEDAFWPPLKRY